MGIGKLDQALERVEGARFYRVAVIVSVVVGSAVGSVAIVALVTRHIDALGGIDWATYALALSVALIGSSLLLLRHFERVDANASVTVPTPVAVPPPVAVAAPARAPAQPPTNPLADRALFEDEAARRRERERLGLRPLGPLEVGECVLNTPRGSYFYLIPLFVQNWRRRTTNQGVNAQPYFYGARGAEIHRMHDGSVYLLGYVSGREATQLADPKSDLDLEVFMAPWADRTVRARIPLDRGTQPIHRKFAEGELLKLHLAPLPDE